MSYNPSFSLNEFFFDRVRGRLIADMSDLGYKAGERFPESFSVTSHHTNNLVVFVLDQATMEANEWFDGMEARYVPIGYAGKITSASLIND